MNFEDFFESHLLSILMCVLSLMHCSGFIDCYLIVIVFLTTCDWNMQWDVGYINSPPLYSVIHFVSSCQLWWLLQNGKAAPASKSRIPQMVASTLGFGQKHDATVDIPLDSMNVMPLIFYICISYIMLELLMYCIPWCSRIRRKRRKNLQNGKQTWRGGKGLVLQFN